tara:strand:- start:10 stop:246 length:237 start_codon:yes stop_codon:yes gene_type:complete
MPRSSLSIPTFFDKELIRIQPKIIGADNLSDKVSYGRVIDKTSNFWNHIEVPDSFDKFSFMTLKELMKMLRAFIEDTL